MRPSGALMIEHRLIERVIEGVRAEARQIEQRKELRPIVIDKIVDFLRTYADRTHHGKEEDILFRDLAKKSLSLEDNVMMQGLIEEHRFARRTTMELVEAKEGFTQGRPEFLSTALEKLRALTRVYPSHIAKEDRIFFPAAMRYLSKEEQQKMLEEFWEFDRRLIHEKYRHVVEELEMGL